MTVEYRIDKHFRSGPVRHVVEADRLVMTYEKTGKTETVPFSSIAKINLLQEMQGVFSVRLTRTTGGAIAIPSRHFLGLGRFENRYPEYVAFVRALHSAVQSANPRARFVAGSSLLFWLGLVAVGGAALMCAMLVYGIFVLGKSAPPLHVMSAVPIAFTVGGGFLAQGRARAYDPRAIPAKLLPSL